MKYAQLDDRIVRALKRGVTTFNTLHRTLNELTGNDEPVGVRQLNLRLHFLQRRGLIKYTGSGTRQRWTLVDPLPQRKLA